MEIDNDIQIRDNGFISNEDIIETENQLVRDHKHIDRILEIFKEYHGEMKR